MTTSNNDPNLQDVKQDLGNMAREKAETGQHKIADGADALSDAIDAAASNLDDHDREGLANYARKLSSNIASAAKQIEGRSLDELATDAKRLARNNPALFMLGSIAVGFGLSRFLKASAEHDHNDEDSPHHANPYRTHDLSGGKPSQQPMTETYDTSTVLHDTDGRNML